MTLEQAIDKAENNIMLMRHHMSKETANAGEVFYLEQELKKLETNLEFFRKEKAINDIKIRYNCEVH